MLHSTSLLVRWFTAISVLTYGAIFGSAARAQSATVSILRPLHLTRTDAGDGILGLTRGNDGNFYGSSSYGGDYGSGAIFSVSPTGDLTVLHSFADVDENLINRDGASPTGALVLGNDGNFYGTTAEGGTYGDGTIFRVTPNGALITLYNFGSLQTDGNTLVGIAAYGGIVQGDDANFYGTTAIGGAGGSGTFFRITPTGALTVLFSFPAGAGIGRSPLLLGSDGNFYGTSSGDGASRNGAVYQITPAGVYTILHSLNGTDEGMEYTGYYATSGLVEGRDGKFYGVSDNSFSGSSGSVYSITATGAFTLLHTLTYDDGASNLGALVQSSDGNFYGTTASGGANQAGTIFSINSAGVFTLVHNFSLPEGYRATRLTEAGDGNFYGATNESGLEDSGTIYQLNLHEPSSSAVPVIISSSRGAAVIGSPFVYRVVATNLPTTYTAGNLPAGLSLDAATGLITGVPSGAAETDVVMLQATNAKGTDALNFTLTINPTAPVVSLTKAKDGHAQYGVENGVVLFKRTGSTSGPLTVSYRVEGTAVADVDFKSLSGTVTIPAGATQAKVRIKPLDNPSNTSYRRAKLVLLPAANGRYLMGSITHAAIRVLGGE